ncbi:MAG: arylsulfatase [Verrucomicrobiota bacterium]|jgi:arylsulfatase
MARTIRSDRSCWLDLLSQALRHALVIPRRRGASLVTGLVLAVATWRAGEVHAAAHRPNFLVILADDLGFSDVGCYGGEIPTPHIDRLAAGGVRFTQFYNTGRCWPSRAALMSGHYPQQVRMDPPRGRLPTWARLLPHHLRPAGYRSYHAGKWHVMGAPKVVADGGFDRSYVVHDHDRNFGPRSHALDDQPLPPANPASGYYTSTEYATRMVGFLKDHARDHAGQPFLAYLAFTAPHFPLQAPAADIARHMGRYDVGWDFIRDRRWVRSLELGLFKGENAPAEPGVVPHWNLADAELRRQLGPDEVARAVPWNPLSAEEKRFQATKMAIHAAMVERMDSEIGRVLEQLRAMDAWEDTVVFFASDNGASAEFLNRGDRHDPGSAPGSAASFLCLGPGWSSAANTPFRLHKSWVHEGGIATPAIVHWPRGLKSAGGLRRTPAHLVDVVPTLLEAAGVASALPAGAPPLPGRSLVPALAADVPVARDFLYFHHEHNRALRVGDWKIVTRRPATNDWSLYHLGDDRAEQVDLASKEPARLRRMAGEWERITRQFAADADGSP